MAEKKPFHLLAIISFAALLLLPSIDTVLKYTGIVGCAAFLILGTAALLIGLRSLIPPFLSRFTERSALITAVLLLAVLAVIAIVGYPMANSGVFGPGGDVDDAMISAARDVLAGEYPYYKRTYLGLLISPMPGAIFLAIPFVATGTLYLQNIFWLGALFAAVRRQISGIAALGVLLTLLAIGPTVYHGIVTGSDYISNTIYLIIAMWFMASSLSDPDAPAWKRWLPAALLGIALSSRTNFYLSLPLFFSLLVQNAPFKAVMKYLAIAAAVFIAVTFPFWIYDPAGFAPLASQASKVKELETYLPFAGILIPGTSMILSIALSFQKMERDCAVFFRNSAIVQLYVLLFTSTVFALQRGQLNYYMAHAGYGMFVLFFAVLAAWITILKHREERPDTAADPSI